MNELLYGHSSVLIVSTLFLCMLFFTEIGFRTGSRKRGTANESIKSQTNSVLASMLGLLALLLGFTFSLALQRYEDRSQAVVGESNAIGTAYLRARLLPIELRSEMQSQLRQYLSVRIREGRADPGDTAERASMARQTNMIAAQLWDQAVRAVEIDGRPATTGLFIQSLNELFDASDKRQSAFDRHVPEIVLFIMFATFIMTTATLGYASGVSGHRVTLAAFTLVMLITFVVYLIIDLDRPKRGFIQVSQEILLNLQRTIETAPIPAHQPGSPANAPKPSFK
jgi:hypothetical protein